jgi:hypothetical protein
MEKYDVKKARKALYTAPTKAFKVVEVPELQYLAVEGKGDPNAAPAYGEAVEALYGTAYALKFTSKNDLGKDFVVAPMEGLWRADDPSVFLTRRKEEWRWTMLIGQPDWIDKDMVVAAVKQAGSKKANPALGKLRLRTINEGICVQILHIGSYDSETPTLKKLHEHYLPYNKLTFNGDHHEIYLSDARRTVPAKLRTILRQPVKPTKR